MTTEELRAAFGKHGEDEYLQFERVENPAHRRPDICAFIMLDRLVPGTCDMVSGASHDEIYLHVGIGDLAAVVTDAEVRDLARCGVRYDADCDSLAMFA